MAAATKMVGQRASGCTRSRGRGTVSRIASSTAVGADESMKERYGTPTRWVALLPGPTACLAVKAVTMWWERGKLPEVPQTTGGVPSEQSRVSAARGKRRRAARAGSRGEMDLALAVPRFPCEHVETEPVVNRTRDRPVPGQSDIAGLDLRLERRVSHPNRSHAAERTLDIQV